MKKSFYLKIFFSILISLITVRLVSNKVFVASTPKVNPDFYYTFVEIADRTQNKIASLFHNRKTQPYLEAKDQIAQLEDKAKTSSLNKIAQGVYAADTDVGSVYTVKVGEIEWVKHMYLIKGENITIYVEKGKEPPTEAEVIKDKVFYK